MNRSEYTANKQLSATNKPLEPINRGYDPYNSIDSISNNLPEIEYTGLSEVGDLIPTLTDIV